MINLQQKVISVGNLGLLPAAFYAFQRVRHARRPASASPFRLYTRYARHPLQCRPGTSDVHVFSQIFAGREYRCLDDVAAARLIVDCGANVGYSAAYFLTRYPQAELIAIEPDPMNFGLLEANIAPYGSRCRCICSGVWSHTTGLVISEESCGDNKEWARTVRPAKDHETPGMMAVDIGTLLAESGHERISILKVDIEGSEAEVFSTNYAHWLERVDNLVIELHGPRCKTIFAHAIKDAGFIVTKCDELTVCRRR